MKLLFISTVYFLEAEATLNLSANRLKPSQSIPNGNENFYRAPHDLRNHLFEVGAVLLREGAVGGDVAVDLRTVSVPDVFDATQGKGLAMVGEMEMGEGLTNIGSGLHLFK